MTATPGTIAALRALSGLPLILGATAYIEGGTAKMTEARTLRDRAVAELSQQVGPAEAARQSGLSISTVKIINRINKKAGQA